MVCSVKIEIVPDSFCDDTAFYVLLTETRNPVILVLKNIHLLQYQYLEMYSTSYLLLEGVYCVLVNYVTCHL